MVNALIESGADVNYAKQDVSPLIGMNGNGNGQLMGRMNVICICSRGECV